MIKKYSIYIGILAIGLLLGYFIFGNSGRHDENEHPITSVEGNLWTCSMHPQIALPEKGDCPLCGMTLVTTQTGGSLMGNQFEMSEEALALANIETTVVGVGGLENSTLTLSGKITANEKTNGVQTTLFDGRIEKLNVNYVGEYVKKGQQLGVIYSPELYLAQDKLLTSASYKDSHQKLYAAARNTLGLWKMTDEQIEEVLRSKTPMVNFPIYSDVSGTVTEIMVAEGNWYKQGDPLYKVSNLYSVWAVFDAYESQLSMLAQGQPITISSNAFKGRDLEAKISFIEPIVDKARRTVSVRVTLNNKDGFLKPGMFVNGRVEVSDAQHVLSVPKSAVMWTGKRSLVYVRPNPDLPVFEMTEVTLGDAIGESYIVLDGLLNGDEVVTYGAFTVDAAAQLQGKKSMMTKEHHPSSKNKLMGDASKAMSFGHDFEQEFTAVISVYIQLKDALVASDAAQSQDRAAKLVAEMNALKGAMLNTPIKNHIQKITDGAKAISETSDIKKQREQFKPLSESMVVVASNFDDLDYPIYVQFCPMADGNKGAPWLSLQDQVRNPYFGDMMLTCGSVTKVIQ